MKKLLAFAAQVFSDIIRKRCNQIYSALSGVKIREPQLIAEQVIQGFKLRIIVFRFPKAKFCQLETAFSAVRKDTILYKLCQHTAGGGSADAEMNGNINTANGRALIILEIQGVEGQQIAQFGRGPFHGQSTPIKNFAKMEKEAFRWEDLLSG